jgi:hypothetical protein
MKKALAVILGLAVLCGCSDSDSYTKYSRYKADFTYFYVQTATPLKNALYSPGIYCTIRLGIDKKLRFQTLTEELALPVTATNYYQNYVCISGFIVGYSNLIEVGADNLSQVCYDLACPNCYHDDAISRELTLKENGYAYCSRCKRTYSLNNMGMIEAGESGRPLERYHISLPDQNRMVIYN